MGALNEEAKSIIRNKATYEDLKNLNDVKTNKVDTEAHMRNLVSMHKMLYNVVILMTDHIRASVNGKLESEATKAWNSKHLYDKSVIVQRWI